MCSLPMPNCILYSSVTLKNGRTNVELYSQKLFWVCHLFIHPIQQFIGCPLYNMLDTGHMIIQKIITVLVAMWTANIKVQDI